jgi:hypothetical protein
MFNFLKKNKDLKLKEKYSKILEEAMKAQRNGDIEGYSELTNEADLVLKEIEKIETKNAKLD